MKWLVLAWLAACGDNGGAIDAATDTSAEAPPPGARTVFVIVMENESSTSIYGSTNAPYINSLLPLGASATMFVDELTSLPSEPHYVWMEAGTNVFSDHTFTNDNNSSVANSTANTEHLATQLTAAGVSWVTYQDGMQVGTCPINGFGAQVAKHDPFVFFQDVVGSPPSSTAPGCIAHHKPFTDFASDLVGLAGYVFITPDQCHDMHGQTSCPQGTDPVGNIQAGDTWLAAEMPRIIDFAGQHDAIVILTWDEPATGDLETPFILLGHDVKVGFSSTMTYNHSTMLRTVERYLGVPALPAVANSSDFGELFESGTVP